MKKLFLLLILALPGMLVTAQTKEKKVASVTTSTGTGDSRVVTQQVMSFYDKTDSLAFAFTYNVNGDSKTRTAYKFQFYDDKMRHVSDSTNLNKTYYTYDEDGHIVKVVHWTNYNNPSWPDTKQDSTLYYYSDGKLDSVQESNYARTKYVYFYNDKGQIEHYDIYGINYADNYKYEVINRVYYTYDANGNVVSTLNKSVGAGGQEQEGGTKNTYVYNEKNQLVRDTLVGSWSTVAHEFTYDEGGSLLTDQYYNYNSYDSTWVAGSLLTYQYGEYSADRVVTNIKAKASEKEPTTVEFTFTEPKDKDGLQGYKVFVDGLLADSVYTLTDGKLSVPEQQRGAHIYRLLPVYGGVAANISDELAFTVNVALLPVRNLHFTNKEYSSYWNVTVAWDAPEASDYELTGYRVQVGNSSNNYGVENRTHTYYDYGWSGDTSTVSVYAVYNVGEADPATLQFAVNDHSDQITAHYHNKLATVTDANGSVTGLRHYLLVPKYDDYNVGEDLYVTIAEDADGKPLTRTTADGKEVKKWNAAKWQWDNYKKTEQINNARGLDSLDVTSEYVDGAWTVLTKEYTSYDTDPSRYYVVTSRRRVSFSGNDSTVVNYTRYEVKEGAWGSVSAYVDSLYDVDGNLIGRIDWDIHGYDATNSIMYNSITNYKYVDGNFTPTTRTLYTFNDDRVPTSIVEETFNGTDWVTKSAENYAYTKSKEYSRTHTPEGDFTNDMDDEDNPIVTWPAPVRTKQMTGYDLYLDDIYYASVGTGTTTYSFKNATLPETAKGTHQLRVMAMYDGDESCVSNPVDIDVVSVATATAISQVSGADKNVKRVDVYDIMGRKLDNNLSRKSGQVVIIKTTYADGKTASRKVLLK